MMMHIIGYNYMDTVVGTIARVRLTNPQPHTICSYPSLQTNIYYHTIVVSEDSMRAHHNVVSIQ